MARQHLGQSQQGMGQLLGISKNSWQLYESGNQNPGSQIIAALVERGINANWLLAGEGPMLISELYDQAGSPVDMEILEGILTGLAEIEELEGEPMEPNWRARMTAALYEYFVEEEAEGADIKQDIGKVIKLIRKAG